MTSPAEGRSTSLSWKLANRVLTVTFGDPSNGNVLDGASVSDLRTQAEAFSRLDDVGAVVLRTDGPLFCGGGDGSYMHRHADNAESAIKQLADDFHGGLRALLALDVPIVAAVQGPAAGAGMSIACIAHLVVASSAASFVTAYAKVGLTPDGGLSWTLARMIGERRALELLLTNRRIEAEEALAIGLVNEIVEPENLDARATELAELLANGSKASTAETLKLVAAGSSRPLDEHLDAEATAISAAAAGADGLEGIAAFVARRPAQFNRR